jgi:Nucleoside 2-deoxyribosyltransferase
MPPNMHTYRRKMRIYISGPLQGSTDLARARRFYENLADIVHGCGHDPYVPHHNTDPTHAAGLSSEAVFTADIAALSSAHAVIAHVGLPSTGVGAELALAIASSRRVLGLKRPDEKGSRFAEGLILDSGGKVITFAGQDDLTLQLRSWLSMSSDWFGEPLKIQPRQRVVA